MTGRELCACACDNAVLVPAAQTTPTTSFVQASLCVVGTGVTRAFMQQPSVQSVFKGVVAAHIQAGVHGTVNVTADDIYIVSASSCNSSTGSARRRLVRDSLWLWGAG